MQGHIWRTGFQSNELVGVVFDDVPEALERWDASGIKVPLFLSVSTADCFVDLKENLFSWLTVVTPCLI